MKLLTLIVHTDAQQELVKRLRSMEIILGYTISHVEGHGEESESDEFLSARDKVVGFAPRIRSDILLQDQDVDKLLAVLKSKENNIIGQGVYWVTAVEQGGHLL